MKNKDSLVKIFLGVWVFFLIAPTNGFLRGKKKNEEIKIYNLEKEYRPTTTRIFKLQQASAWEVKLILEKMLSIFGTIYVNEKENTIYLTEVPEKMKELSRVIKTLDLKNITAGGNLETKIISLKHSKGEDIISFLRHKLSQEGNIFSNEVLNTLIITDIPSKIKEIENLILALDRPVSHIEIDITIVEINLEKYKDVGFNIFGILNSLTTYYQWDKRKHSTSGPETNLPADVTGFYLRGYVDLSDIISILTRDGRGKVLGQPKIITQNNKTAVISAQEKIPYPYPVKNIHYDWIEITEIYFSVTPTIQADQTINLAISPRVKSLSGWGQKGRPMVYESYLTTNITCQNKQTFILGGLKKEITVENVVGVPVLKSIPILKYLFSQTQKIRLEREVVFFITPQIITPEMMKSKSEELERYLEEEGR